MERIPLAEGMGYSSGSEVVLDGSLREGSRQDPPQGCNSGLRPGHRGDDGNFKAQGVSAQILAIPYVWLIACQPAPLPSHFNFALHALSIIMHPAGSCITFLAALSLPRNKISKDHLGKLDAAIQYANISAIPQA